MLMGSKIIKKNVDGDTGILVVRHGIKLGS